MNQVNLRVNYALRTIPLVFYGLVVVFSSLIASFDFWTPMIDINKNFINWFLAGIFNVILVFLLIYIRLMIIRFSFQDLNEKIPHTNLWEKVQFYITIIFIILVVVNGLLLTFTIFDNSLFQTVQKMLIIFPLVIDLLFHAKWIVL